MMVFGIYLYSFIAVLAFPSFTWSFIFDDGYRHVPTKLGEIVGHVEIVNFDGRNLPVSRFLGIPYAEPPVGDLRFQKPVPTKLPTSPFTAHSYGSACIQEPLGPSAGAFSEDCLFLNVFAPANAGQGVALPKPVMVWIHGGGFVFGESNTYESDVISGFADVIVVTINYRLGPIGFFSTHDDYAPGNYGVWDQHAAIKWVKDNIKAFGGDNNNMTIFGQSAGGASVLYQTMYPGNKGLFSQAIMESGSLNPWAYTTTEQNYNSSMAFASAMGCNNASRADMLRCIRAKPSSAVTEAVRAVRSITMDYAHPAWVPVFDGEFVTTAPSRLLQEASEATTSSRFPAFYNTNILVGATSYDGTGITSLLFSNPDIVKTLTRREFETRDIPTLLQFVTKRVPSDSDVNAVVQEYEHATGRNQSILDSLLRAVSDVVFIVPAIRTAQSHATVSMAGTYLYEFALAPPSRPYPLPPYLQTDPRAANHGDELVYLFGFVDSISRDLFNISGPISVEDIKMSKFIMTAWTNFAKSG